MTLASKLPDCSRCWKIDFGAILEESSQNSFRSSRPGPRRLKQFPAVSDLNIKYQYKWIAGVFQIWALFIEAMPSEYWPRQVHLTVEYRYMLQIFDARGWKIESPNSSPPDESRLNYHTARSYSFEPDCDVEKGFEQRRPQEEAWFSLWDAKNTHPRRN